MSRADSAEQSIVQREPDADEWTRDEVSDLKRRNAVLSDALRWVLPMAKGYAAAHPVGNNAETVTAAEEALDAIEAQPTGHWTREPPSVAGWYWVRDTISGRQRVGYIPLHPNAVLYVSSERWSIRIEEPK